MTTIRAVFVNAKERLTLETGDVVFAAGDAGDRMFGVVSGSVELRSGAELVATIGVGETFGEMAIIDQAPRTLTALVAEPTELAAIDRAMFLFLVHETPMFALQVMQALAANLRAADSHR